MWRWKPCALWPVVVSMTSPRPNKWKSFLILSSIGLRNPYFRRSVSQEREIWNGKLGLDFDFRLVRIVRLPFVWHSCCSLWSLCCQHCRTNKTSLFWWEVEAPPQKNRAGWNHLHAPMYHLSSFAFPYHLFLFILICISLKGFPHFLISDILRLIIRRESVSKVLFDASKGPRFIQLLYALMHETQPETNKMLALRCLANAFTHGPGSSSCWNAVSFVLPVSFYSLLWNSTYHRIIVIPVLVFC